MCGLAGIFAYRIGSPLIHDGDLLRMREAIATRGPDGAGLLISGDRQVGLVHRHIAIIDTSDAGAQPMSTSGGALRFVCNGEINNYGELREGLWAMGAESEVFS